jgi:hypothetical protein
MKIKINLVIVLFSVFSCHNKDYRPIRPEVQAEIAKWKKQLLLNGEIGTPCEYDDEENWFKNNPEAFYGLPDTVSSIAVDANKDNADDILLYFPAGDACGGSNEQGSDFVKLIYSNGGEYFTNDNLRTKIEGKIEDKFYEQTNTDVQRAIFSIIDFNAEICGTFQLWTLEDPDCCSSVEGTFKYNPFSFKVEITIKGSKQ